MQDLEAEKTHEVALLRQNKHQREVHLHPPPHIRNKNKRQSHSPTHPTRTTRRPNIRTQRQRPDPRHRRPLHSRHNRRQRTPFCTYPHGCTRNLDVRALEEVAIELAGFVVDEDGGADAEVGIGTVGVSFCGDGEDGDELEFFGG